MLIMWCLHCHGQGVSQVLSELSTNAVVIDTTTMSIAELEQVLSIVRSKGLKYITARLEGGPKQAEADPSCYS